MSQPRLRGYVGVRHVGIRHVGHVGELPTSLSPVGVGVDGSCQRRRGFLAESSHELGTHHAVASAFVESRIMEW